MSLSEEHGTWPQRAVSIIVLPGGEQDERLLSLAEHWTSTWLLGPALWVKSDAIHVDASGFEEGARLGEPPRIQATVLGRNGRRDVDLFEQLARGSFTLVRIVAVRVVLRDRHLHEQQDRLIDVMMTYFHDSKPQWPGVGDTQGIGTEVRTVNLVFAAAETDGALAKPLLEEKWTANLVVSPEDRPAPASFDVFTRETEQHRFDGFVLANTATAGALWSGVAEAFYDTDEPQATGTRRAACIRTFVRGVLTDGMVIRVAGRMMDHMLDPDSLWVAIDERSGVQPVLGARRDQAVKDLVNAAMEVSGGLLTYNSPEGLTPLEPSVIGLGRQFRQFWVFAWDKVKALPRWVVEDVRSSWSGVATKVFQGKGGGSRVEIGGEEWLSHADHQVILDNKHLRVVKEHVLEEFTSQYRAPGGERYPELWENLRALVFGALDGSLDPTAAPAVSALIDDSPGHLRLVIGDPRLIVPAVTDAWSPEAPVGLDAVEGDVGDPAAPIAAVSWMGMEQAEQLEKSMSQLQEHRDTRLADLRQQLSEAEATYQQAVTAAEDLEYELIDAEEQLAWAEEEDDSEETESEHEVTPQLRSAKEAHEEAEKKATKARDEVGRCERARNRFLRRSQAAEDRSRRAQEDLDSLRLWISSHNLSVAGQVLARLRGERSKLDKEVSEARAWLREDTPFTDRHADILRDRFRRNLRIGSLVTIVAILLCVLYTYRAPTLVNVALPAIPWWWWLIACIAIMLEALLVALLMYHRDWSEAKRILDEHRLRVDQLYGNVRQVNDERTRLDGLREPMEDFWRLMSMVIHRPWSSAEGLLEPAGKRPTLASLPASVRLAEPPAGRGSAEESEMEEGVTRTLFRPGWRAEAFASLCTAAEDVATMPAGALSGHSLDNNYAAVRMLARLLENEEIPRRAGAEKLRKLAQSVQVSLDANKHPSVVDLRPDPLAGLEFDADLLGDPRGGLVKWDEHLSEILGPGCSWSPLAFSTHAISGGAAAHYSTFASGPGRLANHFDPGQASGVRGSDYLASDDAGTRSVELVVRIDVGNWLDADAFRVFSADPQGNHESAPLPDFEHSSSVVEQAVGKGLFAP